MKQYKQPNQSEEYKKEQEESYTMVICLIGMMVIIFAVLIKNIYYE